MSDFIRQGPVPPDEQRAIFAAYQPHTPGKGPVSLAELYQRPLPTVRNIIARAKAHDGDPVTPYGHRKRKLTEADDQKIAEALKADPYATNKTLARSVGVDVSSSTITRSLKRAKPNFSRKQVIVQDPREGTEEWKDQMNKFLNNKLRPIPLAKRIYEDETYIYDNEIPRRGRTPKGTRLRQVKPRNPKKYVLHVYAKQDQVLHWELRDKDAQNDNFVGIVKRAAKTFDEDDTLIWDQLGKYGREKNPYRLHWDPEAREAVESAGVSLLMLPPSGYYFMPMDLLFNDLKEHSLRPQYAKNGDSMSMYKMKKIIKNYMDNEAPNKLRGFFAARANARDAKRENVF